MRDECPASYNGAIERADAFGRRISKEAQRRGLNQAKEVSVLGDGALWI